MAKLLLNTEGKVLISNDKVLKAPEVENRLKNLLDTTKSCRYLFYSYKGTSVDELIKYNDTENCLRTDYMFQYCSNLEKQTLLNTAKSESIRAMYYGCQKIKEIKLITDNVNDIGTAFSGCYSLESIDLTSVDKVTNAGNTAQFIMQCYRLKKLIIRNMTKIPPIRTDTIYSDTYHFTGTVNSTYNPDGLKDGRIYVPDNMVESLKTATNWSVYADIIVPLSTLQEE